MYFASAQATLREDGNDVNSITQILAGTDGEGMRTDDFLSFMADIPAGQVQYGKRTEYCDYLATNTASG